MRISDWSSDVCSSDLLSTDDLRIEAGCRLVGVNDLDADIAANGGAARFGVEIGQIGRASCRERVCQYVEISVVAVSLQKKQKYKTIHHCHRNSDNQLINQIKASYTDNTVKNVY